MVASLRSLVDSSTGIRWETNCVSQALLNHIAETAVQIAKKEVMAKAIFPKNMAALSGIPPHQLEEVRLLETLARMGLDPGPIHSEKMGDTAIRQTVVHLGEHMFRVMWFACDAKAASRMKGQFPGGEGRLFLPPEETILAVSWPPDLLGDGLQGLQPVLTFLAMLCAFLFPAMVGWHPARTWSEANQFALGVEKFVNGEAPPILNLVAFEKSGRDKGAIFKTRGLDVFAGQEFRARVAMSGAAETVRRLARLALDVIVHGPVTDTITVNGLAADERIVIRPLSNTPAGNETQYVDVSIDTVGV